MKFLWLDTETTGVDPVKNDPIQIAGFIEYKDVFEEFNFRSQPFSYDNISEGAQRSHGKTIEQIRTFEDPRKIFNDFIILLNTHVNPYIKSDKFILSGQNVGFDSDMMREFFKKNGNNFWYSYVEWATFDLRSVSIQYEMVHGRRVFPNYKLETICEVLEIPLVGAHDALEDITATRLCCIKIWETISNLK